MRTLLLVGSGRFLGSIARYALTRLLAGEAAAARFPLGTLVVNVLDCFAIGVITGLLGGFTTC